MFCPECGQKLALPTTDLRVRFRCPRCHTVHEASSLVPKRTTVPAVPIVEFQSYEQAMVPEAIGAGRSVQEEPVRATVPMHAVPALAPLAPPPHSPTLPAVTAVMHMPAHPPVLAHAAPAFLNQAPVGLNPVPYASPYVAAPPPGTPLAIAPRVEPHVAPANGQPGAQ